MRAVLHLEYFISTCSFARVRISPANACSESRAVNARGARMCRQVTSGAEDFMSLYKMCALPVCGRAELRVRQAEIIA